MKWYFDAEILKINWTHVQRLFGPSTYVYNFYAIVTFIAFRWLGNGVDCTGLECWLVHVVFRVAPIPVGIIKQCQNSYGKMIIPDECCIVDESIMQLHISFSMGDAGVGQWRACLDFIVEIVSSFRIRRVVDHLGSTWEQKCLLKSVWEYFILSFSSSDDFD